MGTDADKLQRIGPALAVHEHDVGPQMAVGAVRIPALHRMFDVTGGSGASATRGSKAASSV